MTSPVTYSNPELHKEYEGVFHCEFNSLEDALNGTFRLANQPFEMDALDFRRIRRDGRETTGWIRLGGLSDSLPGRLDRLSNWLENHTEAQSIQEKPFEQTFWDGKSNGLQLPEGTYIFQASLLMNDDLEHPISGPVTLIR